MARVRDVFTMTTTRSGMQFGSSLTAIVLDASAFGGGDFDAGLASEWAAAGENHNVEVWIPEPAFLELAEHAITEDAGRVAVLRKHNRARTKIGLPPVDVPEPLTVEGFRDLGEEAGALIIELEADDALEALRDQILQTGPGHRKKTIKTGAADSAWLRAVVNANDGSFDGLVLVTGDLRAVERFVSVEQLGQPQVVVRIQELNDMLGETRKATEEEIEAARLAVVSGWDEGAELVDALRDHSLDQVLDNPLDDGNSLWERQGREVDASEEPTVLPGSTPTVDPWLSSVQMPFAVTVRINESYVSHYWTDDDPLPMRDVEEDVLVQFDVQVFSDGDVHFDFDNISVSALDGAIVQDVT